MDKQDRLKQQIEYILQIDKTKNIIRRTHLTDHGRLENVAEHSWHIAMMAYVLREYCDEPIDIGKVMLMCLMHDVVEIFSGDTYAYDTENLKTQKAREDKAKIELFSMLPKDQMNDMIALFDDFNAGTTAEARFAKAMDNLQPLLLNYSNKGIDWKERGVFVEQVLARQEKTKLSSRELYDLSLKMIKEQVALGNLKSNSFEGNA